MNSTGIALVGCIGLLACSSNHSPAGGSGGSAETGAGGSLGSGSVSGSTGGVGDSNDSGGGGNSSNAGGVGSSANVGGAGNSVNVGGTGNSANVGGGANEPIVVSGCGATKLYQADPDPGKTGPWPVGVKTASVAITGGSIKTEIWYPATFGSDAGKTPASYDLASWLGATQEALIPPTANAPQICDFSSLGEGKCYRDLPLDAAHGPYPAVIFIHGTGSFRTASLSTMVQWASRGFIVVAADHPGLFLSDFLGTACGASTGIAQDLSRDVDAEIAALNQGTGDLAFLGTSIDTSRIGISGHSQGASNAASFGNKPHVQVDMPLADLGGTAVMGPEVKSVLLEGGENDTVVAYSADQSAYTSSVAAIKRIVGIKAGNHLDVTDLCWEKNSSGQTAIQVANQYLTCSITLPILDALAQCGTMPDPTRGPAIVNYTTTAALEETLHCVDRSAAFDNLKTEYPDVSDFQHAP